MQLERRATVLYGLEGALGSNGHFGFGSSIGRRRPRGFSPEMVLVVVLSFGTYSGWKTLQ
jgi:hypothetical protein